MFANRFLVALALFVTVGILCLVALHCTIDRVVYLDEPLNGPISPAK